MLATWKRAGSIFRAGPIESRLFKLIGANYTKNKLQRTWRKHVVEIFTSFHVFHAVQTPPLGTSPSLPAHVTRAAVSASSLHPQWPKPSLFWRSERSKRDNQTQSLYTEPTWNCQTKRCNSTTQSRKQAGFRTSPLDTSSCCSQNPTWVCQHQQASPTLSTACRN